MGARGAGERHEHGAPGGLTPANGMSLLRASVPARLSIVAVAAVFLWLSLIHI